jgi:pyruvate dehydrogenase E1 component alpha subunit
MPAMDIDGTDVEAVWQSSREALRRARDRKGPTFLLAYCPHPEGHFLGDPLLRIARNPVNEIKKVAGPMMKSVTRVKGGSVTKRTGSLGKVSALIGQTTREQMFKQRDPLKGVRRKLKTDKARLKKIEERVGDEIQQVVKKALKSKE